MQMLKFIKHFCLFLIFVSPFIGLPEVVAGTDPFIWELTQSSQKLLSPAPGQAPLGQFRIGFQIPEGHYLYKDKMEINFPEESPLKLVRLEMMDPLVKIDPYFGKKQEIYEQFTILTGTVEAVDLKAFADLKKVEGTLSYQGCKEGLCYPKQTKPFTVQFMLSDAETKTSLGRLAIPFDLEGSHLILVLAAYVGGIATDFTPCVLPLIPLTLAFIGVRRSKGLKRNFVQTAVLIGGMAGVYAVLGLIAALFGKGLGFLFQSIWLNAVFTLLFILMALSMFGLFELRLPTAIVNRASKMGGQGLGGSLAAGATLGVLAAPCVGPIIGTLLFYVAQSGDVTFGFILLFLFGLGMGTPFLIIGTFFEPLKSKFGGALLGRIVKIILGIALLFPALHYGRVVTYQILEKVAPHKEAKTDSAWFQDLGKALTEAQSSQRPLLVKFGADWCFPCLLLEKDLKEDARFKPVLEAFVLVSVDCTSETEACNKAKELYGVRGMPTVLLLSPEGTLGKEMSGYDIGADAFLKTLNQFLDERKK